MAKDTVIDSYEKAQAHRNWANKPKSSEFEPEKPETAEAEPASEHAVAKRATRKRS